MPESIITVVKRDSDGTPLLEYTGHLMDRGATWLCLEAYFSHDHRTDYVHFRPGDRMVEWFYSDRWYNIFELHDVDDDHLKGWYCNIARPAVLTADSATADDLALDIFITFDGQFLLLDEAEFAALDLSPAERHAALQAVEMLRETVHQRLAPFDWLM